VVKIELALILTTSENIPIIEYLIFEELIEIDLTLKNVAELLTAFE
jgi:hypothetical protein